MQKTNISKYFKKTGIVMFVAATMLGLIAEKAIASEKIIFKYSGATQTLSLEELQTFASTGETSPALDFLLKFGKQNPFMIRWILTQQFPANTKLIYDLLNTAPGEYVLSQTGTILGSKSERANITALRGALVAAASDDNLISLMELIEQYPTEEVYVDGKILSKAQQDLGDFINQTNKIYQDTFK
jgi:hypothetical protein